MKKFTLSLLMMLTFEASSAQAGWFDHQPSPHEQQLEQQVQIERQHSDNLRAASAALGVGCIAMLLAGCALGSRTRRKANDH